MSRKVSDGKRVFRTNAEDRDDMIRSMGSDCFWSGSMSERFREPDVPPCFLFVFNAFLEIFNHSGKNVTWLDISSYASVRKITFRQIEIDYILKLCGWAYLKIRQMDSEEEQ